MNVDFAFNTICAAFQQKAYLANVPILSEWQGCFVFAVCVVIFSGLALIVFVIRPTRRRRRRITAARSHVSAEQFLDLVALGSRYDGLCLAVRKAMAEQTKIPVEFIYPNDSMEFLCSLTYDGYDTVEIAMTLEDELKISIPDKIAEKMDFPCDIDSLANTSLVEWIRGLIQCEEFTALLPEEPTRTKQGA